MWRSKICHRLDPGSQSNYATGPKQVYNASFTIWSKQSIAWFSRNYNSRHQIKSDSCNATILQAQIWSVTGWNQARVLKFSKYSGYENFYLYDSLESVESYPWRKIDEDELRKFITVASPGKEQKKPRPLSGQFFGRFWSARIGNFEIFLAIFENFSSLS